MEGMRMERNMEDRGWNPYIAGVLLGILAIASAYATTVWLGKTNYLGASTTFVRAVGFIEQMVSPEGVAANEYFVKTKVKLDWQFMLVVGILLGAFIASLTDRSFKNEMVPPIWKERFGPSGFKRALGAFVGGAIAIVGARMASGCPSGHGLSGMMQLSAGAFIALGMFFLAGIIMASLVYGRRAS